MNGKIGNSMIDRISKSFQRKFNPYYNLEKFFSQTVIDNGLTWNLVQVFHIMSLYQLLRILSIWRLHNREGVVQRCSLRKVFLKISQNSQENTCVRLPFLIKLQANNKNTFFIINFEHISNLFLVFFLLPLNK